MECIDAQTKIASYVEGNIPQDIKREFLLHMQNCENCREELEIYYTLMEATRQLDEGEITTSNFSEELKANIENELKEIKEDEDNHDLIRFFFVILAVMLFIWFMIR